MTLMAGGYDDFVIARNPEDGSTLPYLVRIPLPTGAVVLKVRDTWPRTSKVYCHRAVGWPEAPDIVERVPVRACARRGASIDLVLDRGRENRSQFVLTRIRGGREAIFWQSARTTKQARPAVKLPTARADGLRQLDIVVDSHERYAYTFSHQQATTRRAALDAGDYGVFLDDRLVASVERKSLQDLVSTLTSGKLKYLLADLAALPRGALVVEDRYSRVFKLEFVRPAVVADGLAEAQVRWPNVPIVFCETRPLAEEWTYRYLAASLSALSEEDAAQEIDLPSAGPLAAQEPDVVLIDPEEPAPADVRRWALEHGFAVSARGRIRAEIRDAYREAQEVPDV